MEQHGGEPCEKETDLLRHFPATDVVMLGESVEDPHEHGKSEMPRNGENRTGKRHLQSVAEHVLHVLEHGETHRSETCVDDSIEPEVEIGNIPTPLLQEEELRPFLHRRNNEEGEEQRVYRAVPGDAHIEHDRPDKLEQDREKSGLDALDDKRTKQARILFLHLVQMVDIPKQEKTRNECRAKIDERQKFERPQEQHRVFLPHRQNGSVFSKCAQEMQDNQEREADFPLQSQPWLAENKRPDERRPPVNRFLFGSTQSPSTCTDSGAKTRRQASPTL